MSEPGALDATLALLQGPGVRSSVQREYLRMLHELQVHQAELELQNDALQRAQQGIEDARERYFELYELAPVGYATLDENGTVLGANLMLATLAGVERSRLVGSLFSSRILEGDRARFAAFLRRALRAAPAKQTVEVALLDGSSPRPVMLEAGTSETTVGDPAARGATPGPLRVAVIDLTSLKRTQEQLRERERHLRAVLDTVADGILTIGPNGTIEGANPAAGLLLRTSPEWLHGQAVSALLPDVGSFVGKGRAELQATRPDGSTFPAEVSVNPLVEQDRTRLVVVVTDVSERKQRQLALEETLAHFRQFAENVDDAIFVVDAETGRTLYASPAFATITGRPVPEVGSELLQVDWIHEDDREKAEAAVSALLDGTPLDLEYRLRRPDGNVRTVRARAFPIPEHGRITGILHDMTAELLLQAELRQAQRLEAIGTLASGVAHDFNNLLMGVGGCLQLALRRIDPEHGANAYLRRAVDAILRGANLTRQILRFSDTRTSTDDPTELDAAVTDARPLIQSLIGEQISLCILTGAPGLCVAADPGDIEQVLLNLASNARDAMPGGGVLTLRSEPLQGGRVALSVRDVGTGMSDETRRRVFEPFYTTKEVGKGTGLGLSTVFAVVRRMGGSITIDSALGKGTTFTLNFPVVISEAAGRAPAEPLLIGEGQTILVVDDDPLIRMTVETYVESLGYRALTAASVADALKLYTESAHLIDAVLTDIMMPGLLGSELGRILENSAPGIAVIFMSAHPHRELVSEGHVSESSHWLAKPFDTRDLGAVLRRALRQSQPPEQLKRLRIFAVDDDRDVIDALHDLLEMEGHEVGIATTARDALRDIPAFRPDIVLCDIHLNDDINGLDLVARLRNDARLKSAVFLAVTGLAANPIRSAATEAGFHDVLIKPLDFQRLSSLLVSYVIPSARRAG